MSVGSLAGLAALVLLPAALVLLPWLLWRRGRTRPRGHLAAQLGSPATSRVDTVLARVGAATTAVATATVAAAAGTALVRTGLTQTSRLAQVTVAAMGFLRALLRPLAGAAMFGTRAGTEAANEAGKEAAGAAEAGPGGAGGGLPMVEAGGRYVLAVGYQASPPASYAERPVDLHPLPGPLRLELRVEGVGLEVAQAGRAGLDVRPGESTVATLEVHAAAAGDTRLRIDCFHGNAWVQSLEISFAVKAPAEIAALRAAAAAPGDPAAPVPQPLPGLETTLTLPVLPPQPPSSRLNLHLVRAPDPRSGSTYAGWVRGGPAGERRLTITLGEQDLREINDLLRAALRNLNDAFGERIAAGGAPDPRAGDLVAELAESGNLAFRRLFPDEADRRYLVEARAAAGDAELEISTDSFFLPWEVLHDAYDAARGGGLDGFWGLRHPIARSLTSLGDRQPPILRGTRPRVVLFDDPTLSGVGEGESPFLARLDAAGRIELHRGRDEALAAPAAAPGDEAPASPPESASERERQRRARFFDYSRRQPSEIVHFACHAIAARLPAHSFLHLAEGFDVRVVDMETAGYVMAGSPLVILNACGTGVRDPLRGHDFVRSFLASGRRGVVATECDVPDVFAAAFVESLYGRILDGEPVAGALFATRRRFRELCGNPLGLLYAAYLPFETAFERGAGGGSADGAGAGDGTLGPGAEPGGGAVEAG